MHFKFLKKTGTALLAVTLAFTTALMLPTYGAAAESRSEVQAKVDQLEKEKEQIQARIDALEDNESEYAALQEQLEEKIANIESQIALVNERIDEVKAEIEANEREIAEKEAYLEQTKDTLRERLRAIYVAGTHNQLAVLLSADDYTDFLARTELMRGVTEHDTQLMNEINAQIQQINEKKAENEANAQEVQSLKETLVARQKELDAEYAANASALSKINANRSSQEEDLQETEQELKEKQAMLASWEDAINNNSDPDRVYSGDAFAWPFQSSYYISSPYGYRSSGFHTGTDITCSGAMGKPIYAAADGVVITARWSNVSYGNHLIIDHGQLNGNQYSTVYAHCSTLLVSAGQSVKKGQLIARVGSTGNSSGPHLHFEVRVNGQHTNPMSYSYSNGF